MSSSKYCKSEVANEILYLKYGLKNGIFLKDNRYWSEVKYYTASLVNKWKDLLTSLRGSDVTV